jgi:signal transduction histidine kinase
VENHGGRIWLDTSHTGDGARICFTLRTDSPSSETRMAAATSSTTKGSRS